MTRQDPCNGCYERIEEVQTQLNPLFHEPLGVFFTPRLRPISGSRKTQNFRVPHLIDTGTSRRTRRSRLVERKDNGKNYENNGPQLDLHLLKQSLLNF